MPEVTFTFGTASPSAFTRTKETHLYHQGRTPDSSQERPGYVKHMVSFFGSREGFEKTHVRTEIVTTEMYTVTPPYMHSGRVACIYRISHNYYFDI
jgi:hypothetical protein